IDEASTGEVTIEGNNPHRLSKNELAKFRRQKLGFVFQDFNLLHTLTVEENIVLPLTLDRAKVSDMKIKVKQIAKRLGISEILQKTKIEFAGGLAQRVSVAQEMNHDSILVLADEPTVNLDSKASKDVMEMLKKLNEEQASTMMLVSHEAQAASYCDRVIFIQD